MNIDKKTKILLAITLLVGLLLGALLFGEALKKKMKIKQMLHQKQKHGPVLCIHKLDSQNQVIVLYVEWI